MWQFFDAFRLCSTFSGFCPLLPSRWLFWQTSTAILVDKPLRPASSTSLVDYPRWLPSRLSSVTTLGDHPLWLFTTTVLCNHSLWPFPMTIRYSIRSPYCSKLHCYTAGLPLDASAIGYRWMPSHQTVAIRVGSHSEFHINLVFICFRICLGMEVTPYSRDSARLAARHFAFHSRHFDIQSFSFIRSLSMLHFRGFSLIALVSLEDSHIGNSRWNPNSRWKLNSHWKAGLTLETESHIGNRILHYEAKFTLQNPVSHWKARLSPEATVLAASSHSPPPKLDTVLLFTIHIVCLCLDDALVLGCFSVWMLLYLDPPVFSLLFRVVHTPANLRSNHKKLITLLCAIRNRFIWCCISFLALLPSIEPSIV